MKVTFTQMEIADIIRREVNRTIGRNLTASTDDAKVEFLRDYRDGSGIEDISFDRVEVEIP
jgi:hypothetical protein